MSLRQRSEDAFVASGRESEVQSMSADERSRVESADERSRVESAARSRIERWCQRMGVTETPRDLSLERRFSSGSGTNSGWFRFSVEDLEFWARGDSDGRFDVFLADSSPHDAPIESLIDLGRSLVSKRKTGGS